MKTSIENLLTILFQINTLDTTKSNMMQKMFKIQIYEDSLI